MSLCAWGLNQLAALVQNLRPVNWGMAPVTVGFLLTVVMWKTSQAATLTSGFSETVITSSVVNPTAMAFSPDGRLFVCQQDGALRVIKDGVLLPTPFVSLSVESTGERGLLGVAFDPNFAANQLVYVYYTTSAAPIRNRVSRFTANGDVATPGSEQVILELETLSATNHNGGAIHFGLDGKLYVAVGENANPAFAQSVTNRLGKLLRINADGSIPSDNPSSFTVVNNGVSSVVTPTGVNRAIWALGLRNPFSFAVQPGTGDIFINDVGAGTWEEINEGMAGANYGWPGTEGETADPRFTSPLYAYDHHPECAITGGTFYNPAVNWFPLEYTGSYFFADFCGGWIKRYDPVADSVTDFATGIANPVDLQVGTDGNLYYLARGGNAVVRVQSGSGCVRRGLAPVCEGSTQRPPGPEVTPRRDSGSSDPGGIVTPRR
jgi:glucose/arabinose dehydrogenase